MLLCVKQEFALQEEFSHFLWRKEQLLVLGLRNDTGALLVSFVFIMHRSSIFLLLTENQR